MELTSIISYIGHYVALNVIYIIFNNSKIFLFIENIFYLIRTGTFSLGTKLSRASLNLTGCAVAIETTGSLGLQDICCSSCSGCMRIH